MTDSDAGTRFSDDRQWWWTGSAWVPASQAPTPPGPPVTPTPPGASIPPRARGSGGLPRWLVIVAAILFFPITVVILIVRTKWSVRTKAILSGVWVVFLIFAGVSAGASPGSPNNSVAQASPQTSQTQTAASPSASTAAPTPSPLATKSPKPKPTPTPPAKKPPVPVQTVVKFLNAPLTESRGSYATLQVKTSPNKSCSIEVVYKSGPSTAAGLGPKVSNSAGNVSWTWKVGTNTTRGSWPIFVTCGNGSAQTHINVT